MCFIKQLHDISLQKGFSFVVEANNIVNYSREGNQITAIEAASIVSSVRELKMPPVRGLRQNIKR